MTKIEWTDRTWNPITGCSPISIGCANCYAERFAKRFRGRFGYSHDDPFRVTFHTEKLELPLRWRKPCRIFVNSMGDLFHTDVKAEWIDAILDIIAATPQHTYQVLTKRPGLIMDALYGYHIDTPMIRHLGGGDYLPNLWLGVTAESFHHVNRIKMLRRIPAAVRFVSFEPLIDDVFDLDLTGIDWVIVGGETGPGARKMESRWVFRILDQCRENGIPFFFKKWGSFYPTTYVQHKGKWADIRQFPKTKPRGGHD